MPIAIVIALIVNILIVLWVCIYVGIMYHQDRIKTSEDGEEGKDLYILLHAIFPIINIVFYSLFLCEAKKWEASENDNDEALPPVWNR